jgi:hypothetical protein
MTEDQMEQRIQREANSAPRISKDRIDGLVNQIQVTYHVEGTSTFAFAKLDGKFLLATGHSACVFPANFNAEIGKEIALKDAMAQATKKLWELEGYLLYTFTQNIH